MVGTRRFTLGRQWEEKCEGCPEPLHYTDATYFNDSDVKSTETAGGAAGAAAAAGGGWLKTKYNELGPVVGIASRFTYIKHIHA